MRRFPKTAITARERAFRMAKSAPPQDQPLDFFAIALTILLCAIWGGAVVGIKLSTIDLPPLGSGAIRFCLVSLVLLAWARYQNISLFVERAKLRASASGWKTAPSQSRLGFQRAVARTFSSK
jgi:hypothetical protein